MKEKRSFEVRTVFSFIKFKEKNNLLIEQTMIFFVVVWPLTWWLQNQKESSTPLVELNAPCLISQEMIFQVIKQTVSSMFWLFWPLTLDLVQAIYSLKVLQVYVCQAKTSEAIGGQYLVLDLYSFWPFCTSSDVL